LKHLIMGTAGHIDHGKTALVKLLTGKDCDTHKEEKQRGITIHLGFAYLDLPSGDSIGIIDVPGHKDFVHMMVGGASGIDFTLLVVAADSGVMPQTREHLDIMSILGITKGLVAITKSDLVSEELLDLVKEETVEFTRGTFLEGCPIIPVSSVTQKGLPELIAALDSIIGDLETREAGEVFRMFVDRIFSISGFGTVVTGSVINGELNTGAKAFLLPGTGKELRVRRLERHGNQVDSVRAGDRASINLVGLKRSDFRRGMVITDRHLKESTILDATLFLFKDTPSLKLWSQVIFHCGTYEHQARIHLLDRNTLKSLETALIQVHLESPCIFQYGDHFVIRKTSGEMTLGGGTVIDPFPLHHRRRPPHLVQNLIKISKGELKDLIESTVKKFVNGIDHIDIANRLNVSPSEVISAIQKGVSAEIIVYRTDKGYILLTHKDNIRLRNLIVTNLKRYHTRNPITARGLSEGELMGMLDIKAGTPCDKLVGKLLLQLEKEKVLKPQSRTWVLADHTVTIGKDIEAQMSLIRSFLKNSGMKTPLMSELLSFARSKGIREAELKQILSYLVENKEAYCIDQNYLHASVVDRSRDMLLKALAENPKGLTVSQFRDLVNGNRKICLLMFARYDSEGITVRRGDVRIITKKGHETLQ